MRIIANQPKKSPFWTTPAAPLSFVSRDLMLVSLATDGEDGPPDAAGAVATGETLQRGLDLGLSPEPFRADNQSYSYFSALDDLLKPVILV
ncbi:MAG: MOFRL family protein [Chloroflexota bacterium]